MNHTLLLGLLVLGSPVGTTLPPCPPTPTPDSAIYGVPHGPVPTHPPPRRFTPARLLPHAAMHLAPADATRLRGLLIHIEVVVSQVGCVLDAHVIRGTSPSTDAVVLEASRGLRFLPAQADQAAVTTYVTLSFSSATRQFTQAKTQNTTILWPDAPN